MHKPLHERIRDSGAESKKAIEHREAVEAEMNQFYAETFSTPAGKRVLQHLQETYLERFPKQDATANEIMFGYGQEFVVKLIKHKIKKVEDVKK